MIRLLTAVCWACLVYRAREYVARLLDHLGDRLAVIEPAEELTLWWVESTRSAREWVRCQSYTPRHSWEIAQRPDPRSVEETCWSIRWRTRWAEWPTQFWPTFSPEADAYATVDSTTCAASYDWGDPHLFDMPHTSDDLVLVG